MVAPTRSIVDMNALAAFVEAIVDRKLAAKGIAGTEYTSANPPPHTTSRTFSRWCRSGRVAGAVRDGSGWRCSAEQWRAARAKGPAPSTTKPSPAANDVDSMLTAAGLRPTARRAAR